MPTISNQSQLSLLESLIGNEGIYSSTILESNLMDDGTKVLYLQRAITSTCFEFNEFLNKSTHSITTGCDYGIR